MRLYQDFYDNFVPGDSGFSIMPQLIIVCEDEKHAAEAFKIIVTKKLEINNEEEENIVTEIRLKVEDEVRAFPSRERK